MITVYCNLIS